MNLEKVWLVSACVAVLGTPICSNAQVVLPGEAGAELGQGYDSVAGELRATCVVPSTNSAPAPVPIDDATYAAHRVANSRYLAETAEVGLASSFASGGASGAATASFVARTSFTSFSETFYVRGRYLKERRRGAFQLSRANLRLYQDNLVAFRQKCGDRFVSAQLIGGLIEGSISVATANDSEQQAIRASLNYSQPASTVDLQALKQTIASRASTSLDVQGHHVGVDIDFTGDGGKLIDAVLKIEALSKANQVSNVRIGSTTSEYSEVAPLGSPDDIIRHDAMVKLAEDLATMSREKADLDYMARNPSRFGPFDESDRLARVRELNTLRTMAWEEARPCFEGRDTASCKDLAASEVFGVRTYRRNEIVRPKADTTAWQPVCATRTGQRARVTGTGGWYVSEITNQQEYYRPIEMPGANRLRLGTRETDLSAPREVGPNTSVDYRIEDSGLGDNQPDDKWFITCEFLPF